MRCAEAHKSLANAVQDFIQIALGARVVRKPCQGGTAAARRAGRQPSLGRLAQRRGERPPHFVHGAHDLVEGYGEPDPCQGHLGGCEGVCRADGVARLAGYLHQAANRVADKAQEVCDGQR